MRKFAHYATRYNEHLRSVELDRKRGQVLKTQIDFILGKAPKYVYQDFLFVEQIVDLIVKARRSLANTYPLRFFMKGINKKSFFDFMQKELEISLEKLSRLIIKDITDYIEMNEDKSIKMNQDFFKFKQNANDLKHSVNDHFSRIMTRIQLDFPEVTESKAKGKKQQVDSSDEEGAPESNDKVQWPCFICTNINKATDQNCLIC